MVETFTPAGCGGRQRQVTAIVCFTVASMAAAIAVGAACGALGGLLPQRRRLLVAAGLIAALAALREAGVLRLPVPDLRRQVPERWRRTLPLPVWSSGYGAILGSGFGTYQPAGTYWVVLCSIAATGRPLVGAACMALFGLARGLMVVVPGATPVGRFAAGYRMIRPANALVLVALTAALVVPSPAGAAPFPVPDGVSDPSLSRGNLAFTQYAAGAAAVVVRTSTGQFISYPGGTTPSISGDFLAYADPGGIRIVRWRTGEQVGRVDGAATRPALSGLRLAYVLRTATSRRLVVRELATGRVRVIARVPTGMDLGRPSLWGADVVWHEIDGASHRILRHTVGSRRVSVLAHSSRRLELRDPVIGHGRVAWIAADAELTSIMVRGADGKLRRVATAVGPKFTFTNFTIGQRRILASRWGLLTGRAQIDSIPLR